MTLLFAYDWKAFDIADKNTTRVDCYCLTEKSEPKRVSVFGFNPYIYLSRDVQGTWKQSIASLVEYMLSKDRTISLPQSPQTVYSKSTKSISRADEYALVKFYTWKDMKKFSSLCPKYRLRVHMGESNPIVMFLVYNKYEYTGWFSLNGNVLDFRAQISERPPYPKVASFDIECNSSTRGMPKAYMPSDRIEMISLVCSQIGVKSTPKKAIFHLPFKDNGHSSNDNYTRVCCTDEQNLIEKFCEELRRQNPDIVIGYNIFGFDVKYIVSRLKLFLARMPDLCRFPLSGKAEEIVSLHETALGSGRGTDIVRVDWTSSAYGRNSFLKVESLGRIFIDMFLVMKRFKLEKYSLDYVSKEFLGSSKDSVSALDMFQAFSSRESEAYIKVAEYCIKDSLLVLDLFNKLNMWTDLTEMSRVMICPMTDLYTRGEQSKIMNQVILECFNNGIVVAERTTKGSQQKDASEKELKGAHVLDPVKGLVGPCAVLDFQSLYPSIMMAFNICSSSLECVFASCSESPESRSRIKIIKRIEGTCANIVLYDNKECYCISYDNKHVLFRTRPLGVLPGLAKRLIEERKKVKLEIDELNKAKIRKTKICEQESEETLAERQQLERICDSIITLSRRQNAFKVAANSIYGMTGFENNSYFGNPIVASCVTAVGRSMIVFLSSYIPQKFGLDVVYGDTDSCMIFFKDRDGDRDKSSIIEESTSIADNITSVLPHPITLKFERYCNSILFLTKKRYIMCTKNNDGSPFLIHKGVMNARRGYCNYAKNIYNKVVDLVFRGEDPRPMIYEKARDLALGKVDIQDLVITKSIKDLSSYKVVQPHVAMAMRLKSIGNDVSDGQRLEYVFVVPPSNRTGIVDYVPKGSLSQHAQRMSTPEEVRENGEKIDYMFYLRNQLSKQTDDLMDTVGYGKYVTEHVVPSQAFTLRQPVAQ